MISGAILKSQHGLVLNIIQSAWNTLPFCSSVVYLGDLLGNLVAATIFHNGQLMTYFLISFGMPLMCPNCPVL